MLNPLDGCNILVVEDEALISQYICRLLERKGASVTSVSRLSEGLAVVNKSYSAAILDVRLPDGEVFPVADALSKRDIPIVFHSGHAKGDVLADQYPNAAYIEKPADEGELLGTIVAKARKDKGALKK